MSRESTLAMGRRQAKAGMGESVTITRGTPRVFTDPDTLQPVVTGALQIYPAPETSEVMGPAAIRSQSSVVSEKVAGAQAIAVETRVLKVPVDSSADVLTDDIVTVHASKTNPGLIGRTFRIMGEPETGYTTANRFAIEQIS
jgi:hypothetical protein